jgi:predicted CXXCH cytochrome family protein
VIRGARAAAALPAFWLAGCGGGDAPVDATPEPAVHVGREACAGCHAGEARRWEGSDHDLAMQPASEATVLGDFGGATFRHAGVTSTFFRRDGGFWVRTDGPDGTLGDYRIAYTFGVDPLQQYLIEMPGGRLQVLGLCWDARPAAAGGQRWFHVYPDEEIRHGDPLHWTSPMQTWNYTCAECHSTDLRKNYDAGADRYDTGWAEIDVSCEACHGPGSRHVAWARSRNPEVPAGDTGLAVTFDGPEDAAWTIDPESGTARRRPPLASRAEVETCGRCHARRVQIELAYVHGRPLADTHRIALLEERLYHPDGQILEEVYEYGSFLQSRMYREGVTCSDCHDPHSARLHAEGNALCDRCHDAARFDAADHHHHREGGPGSGCVDCHMPAATYMVVDPRRDHSFRVPRPDLTATIGVPSACDGCHAGRPAGWAAEAARRWYGPARAPSFHYGEALHAGWTDRPGAERLLLRVIEDPEQPGIVRASALVLLERHGTVAWLPTLERALQDADPLVRVAALRAAGSAPPDARLRLAAPLLGDDVRTVRLEAAHLLAALPAALVPEELGPALERGFAEYERAQRQNADRAEAHLNLGWLHAQRGRLDEAEREYRHAIRMDPRFVPAYVNLADLYREQGREASGETVLREALEIDPASADVHHALGLLLARIGRTADAIAEFAAAQRLAPDDARYAYVYGVALHSGGQIERAFAVLESAHRRHPADRDILFALATFHRDAGDLDAARTWARRLKDLAPDDPQIRQLALELGAG